MNKVGQLITLICVIVLLTNCTSKKSESSDTKDSTADVTESTADQIVWKIDDVKDEFGDIVQGNSIIVADFKGKMANSATADADLTVRIEVLADSTISTKFYEYGREPQATLPETVNVDTRIKLANGEVVTVQQLLFQDMMVDKDKKLLNLLLSQSGPVKVIVDLNTLRRNSENIVYNFEIDPIGLKDVLSGKIK